MTALLRSAEYSMPNKSIKSVSTIPNIILRLETLDLRRRVRNIVLSAVFRPLSPISSDCKTELCRNPSAKTRARRPVRPCMPCTFKLFKQTFFFSIDAITFIPVSSIELYHIDRVDKVLFFSIARSKAVIPLSQIALSPTFNSISVELRLKAPARCLAPSSPIWFLHKLRTCRFLFSARAFAIALQPSPPMLFPSKNMAFKQQEDTRKASPRLRAPRGPISLLLRSKTCIVLDVESALPNAAAPTSAVELSLSRSSRREELSARALPKMSPSPGDKPLISRLRVSMAMFSVLMISARAKHAMLLS
mmetsp:Transcript_12533/g.20375  ORF Transcript_12533/g.20375 Transcript_12533/m.20375 type:complete len:305 (+) Transcript_12533:203-1117(+)